MPSLARVILIGNLGHDPEARELGNGGRMALLRVATNRRQRQPDGTFAPVADWHYCTAYGRTADQLIAHAKKGDRVYIDGRLSYSTGPGGKRYANINIVSWLALGGLPAKPPPTLDEEELPSVFLHDDDDLPF